MEKRLNVALVSLNYFEIVHYYNAVDAILKRRQVLCSTSCFVPKSGRGMCHP